MQLAHGVRAVLTFVFSPSSRCSWMKAASRPRWRAPMHEHRAANQRSAPSPPRTREAGSGRPAMLYTDPQFALHATFRVAATEPKGIPKHLNNMLLVAFVQHNGWTCFEKMESLS